MTSQSSDVEVRVDKVSFIVSGTVDIDRIYRALLDVLDDDASGGRVVIHERGVDTIELPRRFSNLEAIIHIKRHVPYVSQDDAPEAKRAKTSWMHKVWVKKWDIVGKLFLDLHKNMSLITFHLFVRLFIYESYLFFLIAVDGVTLVLAPLGLR